jgi:hypothetical protein
MTKSAWTVIPGVFIGLAFVLLLAHVWERSAWWAVLFFVVVLILSHVLVDRFKPSTRALKYVDYVWLTIAALGIIAAASEWNKIDAGLKLQNMRAPYKFNVAALKSQVSWSRSYFCDTQFKKTKYSPANFNQIVAQEHQACAWIIRIQPAVQNITEDIDRAPSDDAHDAALLAASPRVPEFADTVNEVNTMIKELQLEDRMVDRLRAASEESGWSLVLKSFSPYLLAFAIAIRFAKVTGELKADR